MLPSNGFTAYETYFSVRISTTPTKPSDWETTIESLDKKEKA